MGRKIFVGELWAIKSIPAIHGAENAILIALATYHPSSDQPLSQARQTTSFKQTLLSSAAAALVFGYSIAYAMKAIASFYSNTKPWVAIKPWPARA